MTKQTVTRFRTLRVPYVAVFLVATVFCLNSETRATSIVGDQFTVSGTGAGDSFGPVAGTAGQNLGQSFGSGDITVDLPNGSRVYINWYDQDTFVLRSLVAEDGTGAVPLSLTLSDLHFTGSGGPEQISGASFNPTAPGSVYLSYFRSASNPTGAPRPADPTVSFTTNSVSVSFGSGWSQQLISDEPALFFDVVASSGPRAVPESESVILMLLGLLGLSLLSRRTLHSTGL